MPPPARVVPPPAHVVPPPAPQPNQDQTVCNQCGSKSVAGKRFCGDCGHEFAPPPPPALVVPPPAHVVPPPASQPPVHSLRPRPPPGPPPPGLLGPRPPPGPPPQNLLANPPPLEGFDTFWTPFRGAAADAAEGAEDPAEDASPPQDSSLR